MSNPLISFFIICYNQESFIQESIESAFAQTYSPLEIIISDDCSTDRTFEIANELAARYRGPHLVRLNRNPKNIGMGENVNRAMDLCRGELVVQADGDDVSLPTRTEMIHQAWEHSGRRATSIFSSYTAISANGAEQELGGRRGNVDDNRCFQQLHGDLLDFILTRSPVVNGCSNAWSPALFTFFGKVDSDLADSLLSFRTLAVGEMFYIDRPLVKYRRHGSNVSFFPGQADMLFEQREKRLSWVANQSVRLFDSIVQDLKVLEKNGRITRAKLDRLVAAAHEMRNHYWLELQMIKNGFYGRLIALASTARRGDFRCALRFAPRTLPRGLYRFLYTLRSLWRSRIGADCKGNVQI